MIRDSTPAIQNVFPFLRHDKLRNKRNSFPQQKHFWEAEHVPLIQGWVIIRKTEKEGRRFYFALLKTVCQDKRQTHRTCTDLHFYLAMNGARVSPMLSLKALPGIQNDMGFLEYSSV